MEEKKDKKVHTQLFTFFLHLPVTFGTDGTDDVLLYLVSLFRPSVSLEKIMSFIRIQRSIFLSSSAAALHDSFELSARRSLLSWFTGT